MKLSEELIKNIASEIEDGLPYKYACDLFEVSDVLLAYWMHQGEVDFKDEKDTIYSLFFRSIKKAYAKFIRDSKRIIRKGDAGWQGTAWWLERTNRDFQMNSDNSVISENITITTRMRKKDESGRK